ncbi:23659_t:CDS:2, partial [Cetraspora pellucida]
KEEESEEYEKRDIELYENFIHSSNHSIESSNNINMDFNPENLVDSVLNTELDD